MIYTLILGGVLAYLIGSIPTAVWIGRRFYGIDVREHGSGNAGTTNTIRTLGLKPGVIVLVFDLLKGFVPVFVFSMVMDRSEPWSDYGLIGMAACVIIGHIFPIFSGFRGGKGVACMVGLIVALFPLISLGVLAVFFGVFFISHYVSLSSMAAALAFPIFSFWILPVDSLPLRLLSVALAIFIPLTHYKNIGRLWRREERKLYLRKKKTDHPAS